MNLYLLIILLIKFPNIMCDCGNRNTSSCQVFPKDDVDADLELKPSDIDKRPCGGYGFRCLDDETFEICALIEDRHAPCVVDLPLRRQCHEGYICDEENPAFCTPYNKSITAVAENKHEACCLKSDTDYNNDDDNYLDDSENLRNFAADYTSNELRDTRDSCENNNKPKLHYEEKCDNCIGPIYTTTDAPETTTFPEPAVSETTEMPASDYDTILCNAAGFYPDVKNNTNFWVCEINDNGVGFFAVHMKCRENEIFNKQFHACIIPGAIKQCRNTKDNNEKTSFTCDGKNTGKYLDQDNCRYYHVCVNNKLSPIRELLFSCPELTAYDPTTEKCTKKAISRCANNCSQQSVKGRYFCQGTPSRFRQISDCKSYYLCTNDNDKAIKVKCPKGYKVDDNLMECLPKRMARCIPSD